MITSQIKVLSGSSSISVTGLSYVNIKGAGGSVNLTVTSPDGSTISKSDNVFVVGGSSASTIVAATDSSIAGLVRTPLSRDTDSSNNLILGTAKNDYLQGVAGNDVLLGGKGNDTLSAGAGIDRLTGGAGGDLFVLKTGTSDPLLADVITDFNAARGDRIGIVTNSIIPKNLVLQSFDSNDNGKLDATLVQYKNSFLGIVLGSLDANNKSTLEVENFVPVIARESSPNTNLSFSSIF
ncbi:MAG: calcium-binding protein [Nostoc sp. ChiSLP02]|nr:calcium-binding protein [Nostoc sp. DedSLP05]MDZ8102260.1 calcium-binding protein [Nostoc sp. DedSLP01]MDZ8187265.1 calcium-binding protein [Nostoc sp. ChiSLP02]